MSPDDAELIRLFKLSEAEANGLGLSMNDPGIERSITATSIVQPSSEAFYDEDALLLSMLRNASLPTSRADVMQGADSNSAVDTAEAVLPLTAPPVMPVSFQALPPVAVAIPITELMFASSDEEEPQTIDSVEFSTSPMMELHTVVADAMAPQVESAFEAEIELEVELFPVVDLDSVLLDDLSPIAPVDLDPVLLDDLSPVAPVDLDPVLLDDLSPIAPVDLDPVLLDDLSPVAPVDLDPVLLDDLSPVAPVDLDPVLLDDLSPVAPVDLDPVLLDDLSPVAPVDLDPVLLDDLSPVAPVDLDPVLLDELEGDEGHLDIKSEASSCAESQSTFLGDVDPALLEAFSQESAELLDTVHIELEHLEANPKDHGSLLEVRRAMHTLKGASTLCGFDQISLLTHACENLLDILANAEGGMNSDTLRALFDTEPLLRAIVQDALAGSHDTNDHDVIKLAACFDALCKADETGDGAVLASLPEQTEEALSVAAVDDDAGVQQVSVSDAESVNSDEAESRPVGKVARNTGVLKQVSADEDESIEERNTASRRNVNSVNVDLTRVDAVVAKVSELAAHRAAYEGLFKQLVDTATEARNSTTRLQSLAGQIGAQHGQEQHGAHAAKQTETELELETYSAMDSLLLQLQEAVADQQALVQRVHDTVSMHWRLQSTEARIESDLQNALMSIRLVPIGTMRVRLDGIVRHAAKATNKSVRWVMHGSTVSLEKNVYDRLFEPLMHVLRNAVDHGLETTESRRSIGKPETGLLTVVASQENNQIVVEISDDGAGMDAVAISQAAVARGIVEPIDVERMSDAQKLQLVFTPGLSTSAEVSTMSGRGVGLDIVREACLRMGGTVDISSTVGVGTTITLRLPLSLSVARGLIVRHCGHLMAIPATSITALHLVSVADVVKTNGVFVAHVEGLDLPMYELPRLAGKSSSYIANGEVHVLQLPRDGEPIGVLIEEVREEEEMLIKALPPLLRRVQTCLGAYMLPDGSVAPVLNMTRLVTDLQRASSLTTSEAEVVEATPTVLIVDDSMSMRVALSGTLQAAGFKVVTARDGQEALDVLKRQGLPALITLDVEMPRMDGLETLYAIRHLPGAQDLPVFMMTSRGGASHRRAAEQLGATRYFTKPYRDSELVAAARLLCQQVA